MEWLNEPASWQRTGDVLTVSVDPGTDFWRETGYGYIRDSGHVYGEVIAGDLDVSVRVRCILGVQYDQAGVMLRADERTWLKTGVEFFEGRPRLSTVLTLGRSSWMVTDLPEGVDDIVLRVSRRGDAVEVRYVLADGPAELAALVFMPPGREILAGVMCAAPEGPGFSVTFHELRITERDWSAQAAGGADWQEDAGDAAAWREQEAWAQDDTPPEWTPANGETAHAGWSPGGEDEPEHPGGDAPAPEDPAARELAGHDAAGHDAAGHDAAEYDATGHDVGGHDAGGHDAGGPAPGLGVDECAKDELAGEPARDELAGDDLARDEPAGKPAGDATAGRRDGGDAWSAAPITGPRNWARGSGRDWAGGTDKDAAADWDRLAASTHVSPAERWSAQTDADVANEWPGPPLRTPMRDGLPAGAGTPETAGGDSMADAQTDPGLPRPRLPEPATDPGISDAGPARPRSSEPGSSEPDSSAAGTPKAGTPDAGAPEAGHDGPGRGEAGAARPSARETRRARSKRAPVQLPAEPDAADEWISLLTADPVDE